MAWSKLNFLSTTNSNEPVGSNLFLIIDVFQNVTLGIFFWNLATSKSISLKNFSFKKIIRFRPFCRPKSALNWSNRKFSQKNTLDEKFICFVVQITAILKTLNDFRHVKLQIVSITKNIKFFAKYADYEKKICEKNRRIACIDFRWSSNRFFMGLFITSLPRN